MPVSAYSLGTALSHKYATPGLDIVNSLYKGELTAQNAEAKRAARELKRQQLQDKEDSAFAKTLANVKTTGIHPVLQAKADEDAARALVAAQEAHQKAGGKFSYETQKIINEATNNNLNLREKSKSWDAFYKVPFDQRDKEWHRIDKAIKENGNDARVMEGLSSQHTGFGVTSLVPNYSAFKRANIPEEIKKGLVGVAQDYKNANNIGAYERILNFQYAPEDIKKSAELVWDHNPDVRNTFYDDKYDYVEEKYGKKYAGKPLREDSKVAEDLKAQFIKDATSQGGMYGKTVMDAIPMPNQGQANAYKNEVSVVPQQNVADPIFENMAVTSAEISTPPKGENEVNNYQTTTGFINENGKKHSINLKGRGIDGSIVRVRAGVDPNNPNSKSVMAVISTKSLTDRELHPQKYAELDRIEKIPANDRTADEQNYLTDNKELAKQADKKSSGLVYVPLRDVAKNLQAEFKKYNKTDAIGKLETALGIKYTDYSGDGKQAKPAAPPSGKVTVKDKLGKIGYIPRSQLSAAIKQGYSEVK